MTNFFDSPAMPELSFKEGGLAGWKEWKQWASMNCLEWYKAQSEGSYMNLDDVEIERLALFYAVKSCAAYKKAMMDNASMSTKPLILSKP